MLRLDSRLEKTVSFLGSFAQQVYLLSDGVLMATSPSPSDSQRYFGSPLTTLELIYDKVFVILIRRNSTQEHNHCLWGSSSQILIRIS